MDAAAALADLTEISPQIEHAVVLDAEGRSLAATAAAEPLAERLAEAARTLLAEAAAVPVSGGREVTQLEVALPEASVFVVREAGRTVVARTVPAPTSGLVLYDLRACLRGLAEAVPGDEPPAAKPKPKPRPRARKRKADADAP